MKIVKSKNDKDNNIGDKKFTYSEIVSVGRTVRRYDNLLNNYEQFKDAYLMSIGSIPEVMDAFSVLEKSIVTKVVHFRCMYDHMVSSIS